MELDGAPIVSGGPIGPKEFAVVGIFWLTREIEIATARVSHIKIDTVHKEVSWSGMQQSHICSRESVFRNRILKRSFHNAKTRGSEVEMFDIVFALEAVNNENKRSVIL